MISIALLLNSICIGQVKYHGIWEGKVNVGISLRIAFHFNTDSLGKMFSTMDSPDQSAFGMQTDYTFIRNDSIFTGITKYMVEFAGKLTSDSTISGSFKQTVAVPLLLKKVTEVKVAVRYQTPKPPFPYLTEEVTYHNLDKKANISGTITIPKTANKTSKPQVYPAVLLISGSGPQNRDEEMMGHKPFALIADFLTRKGFIVLRFDDRGTGKSTGIFETATSMDFADDVSAGIEFLKQRKEVDISKIGLLGHSEGGMIAPIVAAQRKDVHFLILMAGPGIKPIDLMTEQNIAILSTMGISKKTLDTYGSLYKNISLAIIRENDLSKASTSASAVFNSWLSGKDSAILKELDLLTTKKQNIYVKNMVTTLSGPWFKFFFNYDPAPVLKKVNAKVLVLNGEKDVQVLPASNLAGMEAALRNSKSSYEIKVAKGVNHLFQTCKTCQASEYGELDETISPAVLEIISEWLTKKVLN